MRASRAAAGSTSTLFAPTRPCPCPPTCARRANSMSPAAAGVTALRGALLTFTGDPFIAGDAVVRYERDGVVAIADGRIMQCGAAAEVLLHLPPGAEVTTYAYALISVGFVDAHVHYL